MKIFTRTNANKTVEFAIFLVGEQYKTALNLADANKGEIGRTSDGKLSVDFTLVKNADAFAKGYKKWFDSSKTTVSEPKPRTQNTAPTVGKGKVVVTDEKGKKYTIDASLLAPTTAPTQKVAPTPTKKDSIPQKVKADLDKLAHTNDNSRAHKVMLKHGYTNSKSDEYQAIWRGYWWTIRA